MLATARTAAVLLLTAPLAAASTETLSPGSIGGGATIETACPTFLWALDPEARGYELVVYRLGEDGSPAARPEVEKSLPAGAGGWTLDRCLEPGGRYAWSVRAVTGERDAGWSEARMFRVGARPSIAELEEALAVVRRYLEAGGVGRAEPAEPRPAPRRPVGEPSPVPESPKRSLEEDGIDRRGRGRDEPDGYPATAPLRSRETSRQRPTAAQAPQPAFHDPGSALVVDGDLILRSLDQEPFFVGIMFGPDGGIFGEGIYTDGNYNLGFGRLDLPPSNGGFNTAIGRDSQVLRIDGDFNTSVGAFSLLQNPHGSENTAIGSHSLGELGSLSEVPESIRPSSNTAIGSDSLTFLHRGSFNTALGADSGRELERLAPEDSTSSFSWNIYIGNEGKVEDEHTIRIGRQRVDTVGHERTFIAGDVAIGTQTGPTNRLVVRDTINGNGGDPGNYVAQIENTNAGDSPDVLALRAGPNDAPSSVNFVGFFDKAGNLLGEIEGNTAGGVRYTGGQLFLIPTDSPPACISGRKGMLYYDASVNRPCYCNGTDWRSVVADGLCT